jgi:carbamoyltransferase
MDKFTLCFKPAITPFGSHDPSAVIFQNNKLVYGVEEERFTRQKHADKTFPKYAIEACLDYCDLRLPDVSRIILPYNPRLILKQLGVNFRRQLSQSTSLPIMFRSLERLLETHVAAQFMPTVDVRAALLEIDSPLPPIELRAHHACHAASAFHPSGFEEALVLTIDGKGEYDATVVWRGDEAGLSRLRTYDFPNSLGHFYGVVTEYLGYRPFNGEGKVMGLAPYGRPNEAIESKFNSLIDTGVEYDVTTITRDGIEEGVAVLEDVFGRERNRSRGEFDAWQKDLAYTVQALLEETVVDIVAHYTEELGISKVCLAGGVALNCKMNKRIMETDGVESVYIQPVAHDAGLSIGAGYVDCRPAEVQTMEHIYWGPEFKSEDIQFRLEVNKIPYEEPDDLVATVAERLADGELVGWFQGRMEMGPRALGNRSILADPRTVDSRDRVNYFVKHREAWRPFAPSILEEAAESYFVDAEPSPFMIKTFDVKPERRDEIEAVVHPADGTTRPQTVSMEQNPRYYQLIDNFRAITGVPVVLNTSFNDHGEPIITTPTEAIRNFYSMGLDSLAIGNFLVQK